MNEDIMAPIETQQTLKKVQRFKEIEA